MVDQDVEFWKEEEEEEDTEPIRSLHITEACERKANVQPSRTMLRGQSRRHRISSNAYSVREYRSVPLQEDDGGEDMSHIPSQDHIPRWDGDMVKWIAIL
jgi:hypothetical protein